MEEIEFRHQIPTATEFCRLRELAGMSPRGIKSAEKGLPNSLFAITAYYQDQLIGMARVVGDGGLNFSVVDVAVHPEFQGRGIGKKLMSEVMEFLDQNALPGSFVDLIADLPADHLYQKFGFQYLEGSVGMYKRY